MTLLGIAGFDHQEDNTHPKFFDSYYSSSSYYDIGQTPRYGVGKSVKLTSAASWMTKDIVASDVVIVGFALYGEGGIYLLFGNSTRWDQLEFRIYLDSGNVWVYRYSTVIDSFPSAAVDLNNWSYYEFKVRLNDTTGFYTIKRNGIEIVSETGVDTLYDGSAEITRVSFDNFTNNASIDDLYICNDSGTENNDFLGEIRVQPLYPSANGSTNDGTASAGSNYECVDEVEPNDDTDYVDLDAVNEVELYALDDMPVTTATKTIYGVQVMNRVKKSDSGTLEIGATIKAGSTTDVQSPDVALTESYDEYYHLWEENPDDSAAFAEADINSLEAGVKVTA